jgi:hypothetical protein
MVLMEKVILSIVLSVAGKLVASCLAKLIMLWKKYKADIVEFMRLRKLKAVHEATHVNCYDCEWVHSRWFWFAASVKERRAVYSHYYAGTYRAGRWYRLPVPIPLGAWPVLDVVG